MKIPPTMNMYPDEARNMLRCVTQGHMTMAIMFQLSEEEVREIWPYLFEKPEDPMIVAEVKRCISLDSANL